MPGAKALNSTRLLSSTWRVARRRVVHGRHLRHHYPVAPRIVAPTGQRFLVLAHGNIGDSSSRPGLQRTPTPSPRWRTVSSGSVGSDEPTVLVITSHLPLPRSTCAHQLADLHRNVGDALADVVATTADMAGFQRLSRLFRGEASPNFANGAVAQPRPRRSPSSTY